MAPCILSVRMAWPFLISNSSSGREKKDQSSTVNRTRCYFTIASVGIEAIEKCWLEDVNGSRYDVMSAREWWKTTCMLHDCVTVVDENNINPGAVAGCIK